MSALETLTEWLVPVPWETRNLSISAFSVVSEQLDGGRLNDMAAALDRAVSLYGRVFVQAHLSARDTKLIAGLGQLGFYFVENSLEPHSQLGDNTVLRDYLTAPSVFVPRRLQGGNLRVLVGTKNDAGFQRRVKEIAGQSFKDGRFHNDWQCPHALAAIRYGNWVGDLLEDSAVGFFVLVFDGQTVGFFAHRGEQLLLAGFDRAHIASGLGGFFWLGVMGELYRSGIKAVHTRISVNNLSVMNLYARIGYKFKNPRVWMHYWSDHDNMLARSVREA